MQDFSNGQLSIPYSRADGMHFIPAPELLVDIMDIQSDNIIIRLEDEWLLERSARDES